jgi:hypothetical protein
MQLCKPKIVTPERQPRPSRKQGSPHRRWDSLYARKHKMFRAVSTLQAPPGQSNSTVICNHCHANDNATASTKTTITDIQAAIPMQTALFTSLLAISRIRNTSLDIQTSFDHVYIMRGQMQYDLSAVYFT